MRYPESARKHGGGFVLYGAAAVIAAVAQLVAGYFYVTSGLLAPLWAVALFLAWWLILTRIGVKLALLQSYWLLLVPVVAVATWFAVMWAGGTFLGWTP
ncbi:hypothetical protein [Arthrobacter sp. NPDC092385]|uniref:hypothetical protein n=1 Tax=Arthrobacter sp. NPDC092385 TaxID=3363943 RepID=UPI00381713F7